MAVTAKMYPYGIVNMGGGDTAGEGGMDILSDTLKCALTDNETVTQATDQVWADHSASEITGTNYTAGGETLGTKTWSSSSLTATFDAADTVWTSASFTADKAHVYDDTPTSPADPLLSWVDFGGNEQVTTANFTIQWNGSGIFAVTVA